MGGSASPRPALFESIPSGLEFDAWYVRCRDHSSKRTARDALIEIWRRHGHLIAEPPNDFTFEFQRRDFPARAWELYILGWLADAGVSLTRSARNEPDFGGSLSGGGKFWVECVAAHNGTGPHAVHLLPENQTTVSAGEEETRRVSLRYAEAISRKIQRVTKYRADGIVQPSEPVLLALTTGAVSDAEVHDVDMPVAHRVLYGFGEQQLIVNPRTGEERVHVPTMRSIAKGNAEVPAAFFLDAASAAIWRCPDPC